MNPYIFGAIIGGVVLIFTTALTAVLTYNSGRISRVIAQSEFWESQLPPLKADLGEANQRINTLIADLADLTARHRLELAEKEAAHTLILAEREAKHREEITERDAKQRGEIAVRDEEIRRWTQRVDRLEQRLHEFEAAQGTKSAAVTPRATGS